MKWLKKNLVNLLLIAMMLMGAGLIAYPTFSDYWNSFHQSYAISNYAETVANIDDTEYREVLAEAYAYNDDLLHVSGDRWVLDHTRKAEYETVLNIGGTGVMGYIEIDKIRCTLPIYHGTEDAILQTAIGHIEGSSVPVGGESTHCVLSGHRGLPSARLFTDLDRLEIGDTFVIRTLDEILQYEVDQILIVEPADLSSLDIEEGKDLCTLITCTPYGVNTHRLLVRGHRVETTVKTKNIRVTADAMMIEAVLVAPFIAVPVLTMLIIAVITSSKKKKKPLR